MHGPRWRSGSTKVQLYFAWLRLQWLRVALTYSFPSLVFPWWFPSRWTNSIPKRWICTLPWCKASTSTCCTDMHSSSLHFLLPPRDWRNPDFHGQQQDWCTLLFSPRYPVLQDRRKAPGGGGEPHFTCRKTSVIISCTLFPCSYPTNSCPPRWHLRLQEPFEGWTALFLPWPQCQFIAVTHSHSY